MSAAHGPMSRTLIGAVLAVAGCGPRVSTSVREASPPSSLHGGAARAPAQPDLRPFSWKSVLVVGWNTLGGPGLASVAQPGQRLSVMVGDGSTWTARVTEVDLCEESEEPEECAYVRVEYEGERGEAEDPPSLPLQWARPGVSGDGVPDDISLLETSLAVAADMALPRFVPHTLEVRYANALCESGADDEAYVLLRTYSSAGEDPVKDAPALAAAQRYPRRVVTLRALDRTLHFVTVAKVEAPRSGRMFDIPARYETAFWILEDVGNETKVLHHEHHAGGRDMNQDTSCQLPLRYPTPWGVVESHGVVHVLTRSNISTFERWTLQPDGLARDGHWSANINPIG